jgi:tetratricopeptide (TPR) repeat protein
MKRPRAWLGGAAKVLVEVGLLVVLPLIFWRHFSEQFTYPKRVLGETLIVIAVAAWTLGAFWEKPIATVSAFLTVGFCRSEKSTVNHTTIDRGYPMAWPLVLLVLALLVSCVNSPVPAFSLRESVYFLCGPAWALVLVGWTSESPATEIRRLYGLSTLGGTVVALIAVGQWTGHDPLAFGGYSVEWGSMVSRMRLYATLGNPNFVAGYLIATVFLGVAEVANSARRAARVAWSAAVAVMLAALLGTGSRGAWIGLAAGLVAATLVLKTKPRRPAGSSCTTSPEQEPSVSRRPSAQASLCAASLGLFSGGLLAQAGWRDLLHAWVQHLGGRLFLWRAAWPMFTEHPIIGSGWASFQLRFLDLQARYLGAHPEMVRHWSNIRQLHNDLLQFLLETGALGLLAWGWVLWAYAKRMRNSQAPTPAARIWLASSAGGITAILVDSLFNFQFAIPPTFVLVFTLLAVPEVLAHGERVPEPGATGSRRGDPLQATKPSGRRWPFVWRCAASLGIVAGAGLLLFQIGCEAVAERDYALGRQFEAGGEMARAEEVYRHGIQADPLNGRLHFGLARVLYLGERYPEALGEIPRAERTFADSHLEVLKARIQDQMGLAGPALATYRHALALDPTLKTVQADIERLSR